MLHTRVLSTDVRITVHHNKLIYITMIFNELTEGLKLGGGGGEGLKGSLDSYM